MPMIKASRDAILKPLQTVAGIVEKRLTMPILANVLITGQGDTVSFVATDTHIQIRTSAPLGTGEANQSTTVSARKLIDILRSLPEGDVSVSLASKKLNLSASKSRYSLQTLEAELFPGFLEATDSTAEVILTQSSLRQLLSMVHFAMALQDTRNFLNGVLLVVEPDRVTTVATDAHRLAYCTVKAEGSPSRIDAIVPRKTVHELLRLLEDTQDPVSIRLSANQIRFRFGSVELLSKLVEGKFPDYQRVIPEGYTRHIDLDRTLFLETLSRASILTTEKFKGVRFTLSPSVLRIQTNNAEHEEAVEELDVDYADESLEIGFNVTYLIDALGQIKAPTVRVAFGDSNSSALISLPDEESFKYVVMPMRI